MLVAGSLKSLAEVFLFVVSAIFDDLIGEDLVDLTRWGLTSRLL